jgi:hypothetical protein
MGLEASFMGAEAALTKVAHFLLVVHDVQTLFMLVLLLLRHEEELFLQLDVFVQHHVVQFFLFVQLVAD